MVSAKLRKGEQGRAEGSEEGSIASGANWTPEPFKKNRPVGLFGPFDQSRSVSLWKRAGFCRDFMGLDGIAFFDSFCLSRDLSKFLDKGWGRG